MRLLGEAISLWKNTYVEIQDDIEYRIAGVQNYGKGIVIRRTVKGSELTMKKYQIIKKNQLMWCKVDTKNGAFGITHDDHVGALASTNMALADINEKEFLPSFIEMLFRLKSFHEWITKYSSGSTNRKYLTPKELMVKVIIPDLSKSDQERFQIKINCLYSSGLYSEITHQQTFLKKLRQQILQEAIEGKLTKDWREQNPNDEHASKLLERIQAEKAQLIKDKKIKKQKPLPPIGEDEKPFELPEKWVWCRLDNVSKNIHYGATKSAKPIQNQKDVRLLRITDIQENTVDWYTVPRCDYSGKDLANYKLAENDILIARTGGTIGKSYLVKNILVQSLFASYLIRVIPSKKINPEFLKLFIESPLYWTQLSDAARGSGQPNVSGSKLKALFLSLPPIHEQKAIVTEIEKLLALCDQLKTQISTNKSHADQLIQAVLKEAFSQK